MNLENMMCSRCHKRMAVIYMTRIEDGKVINEGLCPKCAKELGLKPVDDIMSKMGITDDELDAFTDQLTETLENTDEGELFRQVSSMPIPFMQNFMNPGAGPGGDITPPRPAGEKPPERPVSTPEKKPAYKFLDNFCENLTQRARDGKLDAIVGRDREIYRVVQILNRRTKNNPCLIGEPGVGKTAIAEGIAQRIADRKVPAKLQRKEVYLLDLTGLVAGTQFRGQFESRVKGLLADVKKHGNVILFIDEVHTLVGVGDSEGSMNAANILKPALSRGEIQLIGATTFTEYRKHIEKDAALERRFQPVKVGEPTIEEAVEVLRGVRKYYETFHRVKMSDEIVRRTVTLAERYINDRFLPDKAIDLMDEACSCASLENQELAEYDRLMAENGALENEIEDISRADTVDYERLAEKKSQAAKLQEEISKIAPAALERPVEEEHLAKVIELWTGIPASKIQETELRRVADLEKNLQKKIIGQQEAINQVAAAVRRSRVRISPRKRPASFIFVGPTGVGKTELVKVLSQELFDNVEPLIRLDMSEYMEKHSVSRIIGSPPGYVGYDEAGPAHRKGAPPPLLHRAAGRD